MRIKHSAKLQFTRNDMVHYLAVAFTAFFAILVTAWSRSPAVHIAAMWGLTAVTVWICRLDFLHPYFWFSVFFSLYSTANAILWRIGLRSGNYSREQILYPLIALTVVLLVIGPSQEPMMTKVRTSETPASPGEYSLLELVLFGCGLLTIAGSLLLHVRGYASKTEMRSQGDMVFRIIVHLVRFMTVFMTVHIGKCMEEGRGLPWKMTVFCGAAALLFTLYTSERDVIFRYAFTILCMLFGYGILKPRHVPGIAAATVAGMALSVTIKHYFLRGILHLGSGNIFYDFLSSDFTAAGRNLQYLMDVSWTEGALGLRTYLTELLDPFLIGVETIDPDYWFNYTVHTGGFKGNAFTLVGTGYAIAGVAGIFLIFLTTSLIICFLYRGSGRNIYRMAAYVYGASAVIFSFRQSLRTITGSLVHHVLPGILFCILIGGIRIRVSKKQGSSAKST